MVTGENKDGDYDEVICAGGGEPEWVDGMKKEADSKRRCLRQVGHDKFCSSRPMDQRYGHGDDVRLGVAAWPSLLSRSRTASRLLTTTLRHASFSNTPRHAITPTPPSPVTASLQLLTFSRSVVGLHAQADRYTQKHTQTHLLQHRLARRQTIVESIMTTPLSIMRRNRF